MRLARREAEKPLRRRNGRPTTRRDSMSILSAVQAMFGVGPNKRASSKSEPSLAGLSEEMDGPQEPLMPVEEPTESAKTLGAALRQKAEKGEISSTPEEIVAEARGFGASGALGRVGELKTETAEERRTSVNARGEALAAELAKSAAWRAQGQSVQSAEANNIEIGTSQQAAEAARADIAVETAELAEETASPSPSKGETGVEHPPAPPEMSIGADDSEEISALYSAATIRPEPHNEKTTETAPTMLVEAKPVNAASSTTGEALANELMAAIHSGEPPVLTPTPTPTADSLSQEATAITATGKDKKASPQGAGEKEKDASRVNWQGAGEFEERAGTWGLAYGPIDPLAEDKRKALEVRAQEAAIAAREMLGESLLANPGAMPNMEAEPVDWATAGPFARDTGALSAAATLRRESGSWSSPKEQNPEAIRTLLEESEHASEEHEAARQSQANASGQTNASATVAAIGDANSAGAIESPTQPHQEQSHQDPATGADAPSEAALKEASHENHEAAIDDDASGLSDPEQCEWPAMEPEIPGEGRSGLTAAETRALGRQQETIEAMGRSLEAGLAWQDEHEEIEAPDPEKREEIGKSSEPNSARNPEKEEKE
jgi:hypothetical protein